jgi:predicted nucleotidyltransferase
MRISAQIHSSIKTHVQACIPDSEVFLFGSRVNDSLKGGDIDLLLLTPEKIPLMILNRVRRLILNDIGEQKLDIVNFRPPDELPFKNLAMESAVRLWITKVFRIFP